MAPTDSTILVLGETGYGAVVAWPRVVQRIELASIERDRLRAEAEELRRKAELAQTDLPIEPQPETQTASEAELSVAELKETDRIAEARRRFQTVDEDGDGRLDDFEFRLKSVTLLILLDTNEDDFVTIDETLLSSERFKLFDLDGDGKISQIEFVDTRTFQTIDTDQRGYITFEEYLAFVKPTAN